MPAHARPRTPAVTPMRLFEALCCWILLAGMVLGAQFAWTYWARGWDVSTTARRLEQASEKTVRTGRADTVAKLSASDPPSERWNATEGELIGYLRVPSWGADFRLPVVEGTEQMVLDMMGAGHHTDTAWAGETGDMVVAGHSTYTDLAGVADLTAGDTVIIEGTDHWYEYRVDADPYTIDEHDLSILNQGQGRSLTMYTCWPILTTQHQTRRMVAHASFVGWADKDDGVPQELAEDTRGVSKSLKRVVETVSEKTDMPVTGVLGLGLCAIWLLLDGVCWMVSHRRMRAEWRRPPLDPLSLCWRLTAGVWPSNRVVFAVSRAVLCAVLACGLCCCWFRWGAPAFDALLPSTGTAVG